MTNTENTDFSKAREDDLFGLQMEYEAIRDEIILMMNEQNTHISSLYVIGITILSLGYTVQKEFFFLLLYFVMIPFQILINNKEYMMIRCGVYIKMFIEPKIPNLRWESIVHEVDKKFNKEYKTSIGRFQIENRLCDYGAFVLAVASLISYIVSTQGRDILTRLFGIAFCILGTIILYLLCRKGSEFEKIYKLFCRYFTELTDAA